MYSKSNLFLILIGTIILVQFGNAQKQSFIWVGVYDQCEGKDSGNYTNIIAQESNGDCDQDSIVWNSYVFIKNGPKGEKSVMNTQILAKSRYPAGADTITYTLAVFTSGPLAGKYNFFYSKHILRNYLKKCSSVLGYSFVPIKNAQLLISDNLDPNVLISPNGAYEAFKKGCTTICTGNYYGV